MGNIDGIINILTILLIVLIAIVIVIGIAYVMILMKNSNKKIKNSRSSDNNDNNSEGDNKDKIKEQKYISYDEKSVLDFMEFDKVEDNMIIQKDGTRFNMVIECKGINYDLISNDEKIGVENGFIQYLNSLRYPVQLYIQTRKVNLEENINKYNERFSSLEKKYLEEKVNYEVAKRNAKATPDEIRRKSIQYKKISNIYEYTNDIIQNTKNMSFNKNILSKKYYIVFSYSPADEIVSGTYDKSEYQEKAFNELYIRAKSSIGILAATGVKGKILDSYELAELLYMAYNKEQAEVYGINKIIESRYTDLYITSQDILDKKAQALDDKIVKEAMMMADRAVNDLKSEKERNLIKKQSDFNNLVKEMAKAIVVGEKAEMDEDTQNLVNIIDKMSVNANTKEGGKR